MVHGSNFQESGERNVSTRAGFAKGRAGFAAKLFAGLLGFAAMLAMAAPHAAQAQTATDLNCKGCVGAKELGNNAVTKKKIKNGVVNAKKLGKDAQPAGGDTTIEHDGSGTVLGLIAAPIASVEINAPSDGYAAVNVSSFVQFVSSSNIASCSLATSVSNPTDLRVRASGEAGTDSEFVPLSQVRFFPVTKGTNTFFWTCSLANGSNATTMFNVDLVALFVPKQY